MESKRLQILLSVGAGVVFLLFNAFFIVNMRQQAVVFQFGQFKQAHTTPGLKVKVPFLQDVVYYPKQAQNVSPPEQQVILADQKRVNIDSYAYFRLVDPLKFYQNLRTIEQARSNLGDRINSNMREVLGKYTLADVLSVKRDVIMEQIRTNMNDDIATLGVQLIDVRIGRAELPAETRESIFARMVSEREREAREFRAQGEQEALQIRATADKERTVTVAQAEKEAQGLRGSGDAEASKIYADAFSADPKFYDFYRSLEAYRNTMTGNSTTLVLSPDSDFLKFFEKSN
jgi:membrane protease subunit HflC